MVESSYFTPGDSLTVLFFEYKAQWVQCQETWENERSILPGSIFISNTYYIIDKNKLFIIYNIVHYIIFLIYVFSYAYVYFYIYFIHTGTSISESFDESSPVGGDYLAEVRPGSRVKQTCMIAWKI